jgi:peptidoglycan/xylan/chitin deacetylase (PgdA/CDA1 family)
MKLPTYKPTPKAIITTSLLLLAVILAISLIISLSSHPTKDTLASISNNPNAFNPASTGFIAAPTGAPIPPPPPHDIKKDPHKALIIFTFDDGYVSDYNCAYPILKKYGIRGTSYIIGKLADNNTPSALTWAQIKEMHQYGWVFGCHTYNHVDMTKLTPDEIKSSLEKENATFIQHGLPAPELIAYPSGKYNQQVIDVVKQYRKQGRKAFYESKFVDLNNVKPYEIDSISADMQEEPRLKSREELVDKACGEDAVIVFRTHCMYFQHKNDNGKWDVQTDSRLFADLVKYCVDKGCQFGTMTQLMELYSPN